MIWLNRERAPALTPQVLKYLGLLRNMYILAQSPANRATLLLLIPQTRYAQWKGWKGQPDCVLYVKYLTVIQEKKSSAQQKERS